MTDSLQAIIHNRPHHFSKSRRPSPLLLARVRVTRICTLGLEKSLDFGFQKLAPLLLRHQSHDIKANLVPELAGHLSRIEREEKTRAQLKEMLASEEWAGFWEDNKQHAGVKIGELVRENAAEIVSAVLSESIGNVLSSMRRSM